MQQQRQIRNGIAAAGAVLLLALFAFGALGFSGGASAVTSQYVRPGAAAKKVAKPKAKPKVVVKAKAKAKPAVKKAAPKAKAKAKKKS